MIFFEEIFSKLHFTPPEILPTFFSMIYWTAIFSNAQSSYVTLALTRQKSLNRCWVWRLNEFFLKTFLHHLRTFEMKSDIIIHFNTPFWIVFENVFASLAHFWNEKQHIHLHILQPLNPKPIEAKIRFGVRSRHELVMIA